jgi:phage baseplate assembly protein V
MSDISRIFGRIYNLFSRGVVAAVTPGKLNTLQVRLLADEIKDGVEHFEPYGLATHPLPGAEVAAAFLDGDRAHGLVLVVADRRYRLQGLEPGEVALHDANGNVIRLHADGHVSITSPALVHIESPQVTLSGDLQVAGNITADGQVSDGTGTIASMRSTYNSHNHGSGPTTTEVME